MNPQNVLILPGWRNSDPGHWQSRWQNAYGYTRVEQHDWQRPLRGDWISRLEDVVLACHTEQAGPVVLVAHSLGCLQVAAWAAYSRNTHRVKAALLVAPADVERHDLHSTLPSWVPVLQQRLPFASVVMASSNDPLCALARAQHFAACWGSRCITTGPCGHLNTASALGDWPDGYAQLQQLIALGSASGGAFVDAMQNAAIQVTT